MKKKLKRILAYLCFASITMSSINVKAAVASNEVSTYSLGDVYDEDIVFDSIKIKDTSGKYKQAIFNGNVLFGTDYTELQKYFNKMFAGATFNKPVVFSGNLKIIGADSPTYGEMFSEANFNQGIVLEEGIEIIRGWAFYSATDATRKLVLPNSLKKIYGRAFEHTNYTHVELGPNLVTANDYSFYYMKSLDILEYREGCEDFYVYGFFYWGNYLSDEIKLYLPRSFKPYSPTFYRNITTTTSPTDPKILFNYTCDKYHFMPYVWPDSEVRQYFDENGINYKLRGGVDDPDPENPDTETPGGETGETPDGETPENGGSTPNPDGSNGTNNDDNNDYNGESFVVDGSIFEVEEEVKVVPSTPGFKRVGPTLEVYKVLLKEVDNSHKNKGLRRVTNFIQKFGSSFTLLFKK